jgi:hypothetical protein
LGLPVVPEEKSIAAFSSFGLMLTLIGAAEAFMFRRSS